MFFYVIVELLIDDIGWTFPDTPRQYDYGADNKDENYKPSLDSDVLVSSN